MTKKFNLAQARKLLPNRNHTDNKTAGGKSLIIAGSQGFFGAAVLAATAASRVGAGYVTLMTDQKKFSSIAHPDFLTLDFKKNILFDTYSSVAIGPGLGQSAQALTLLKKIIKSKPAKTVLDADALNLLAQIQIKTLPSTWILTPHEGELARLLKTTSEVIKKNRLQALRQAQVKFKCVVLLKGHKTLVANTKHEIYEIQSGNVSLAKAGTGDVLTGIIAGLLAQGLNPTEAACLGSFLHGKISDNWLKRKNDVLSLMASDLLIEIPNTLANLRSKKS